MDAVGSSHKIPKSTSEIIIVSHGMRRHNRKGNAFPARSRESDAESVR